MKKDKLFKNPYLLFSPFLIALIIYVFILPTDGLSGDQPRYIEYAQNLLHGFYSNPAPDISLMNGPGYPIILMPFLALNLPLIFLTLINPFFYYFSIIFLFKALKEIVSFKFAIIFSLIWACYFIAYRNIAYVATESFTYLLISLLTYSIVRAFKSENQRFLKKYIILAGFILGYLVITKMIFGYVLLFMLPAIGFLWLLNKNNQNYRKGLFIIVIAFITTAPYLLYTYDLTGRIFYWGTGSNNLYWMSTPYEGEYGDWTSMLIQNSTQMSNYNVQGADSILKAHHQEDFNEILKYKGLEQDDMYKELSINNIKSHPIKFIQNVIYNMGRLVFHYPFSHAVQQPKVLLLFPIHGILLTLILFSLIPTVINWRNMPISLQFLLILIFFYFGASIFVSAVVRMFTIIVPVLLIWIAYILENTMKITLKFNEKSKSEQANEVKEEGNFRFKKTSPIFMNSKSITSN